MFGYYVSINGGTSRACPSTTYTYYISKDVGYAYNMYLDCTNCQIEYPWGSNNWYTSLYFGGGYYNGYTFKVKFGSSGSSASITADIYTGSEYVYGWRSVTLGPPSGYPGTISGNNLLLNCSSQDQTNTYTANPVNGWTFNHWSKTSYLVYTNEDDQYDNPVDIKGYNTTYQGMQTLTAHFTYSEQGYPCGTRTREKDIWLNKPAYTSQTVDGNTYYAGYQICPGNHWVGVGWNGTNTTTWTVQPGITYFPSDLECDFTLPSSGYSGIYIYGDGSNLCGTTRASYYLSKKTYGCGYLMVVVFPNPADEEITVETTIIDDKENLNYEIVADEIVLYDRSGKIVLNNIPKESKTKFDIRKLNKGEYFIHIKYGEDIVKQHVLVDK